MRAILTVMLVVGGPAAAAGQTFLEAFSYEGLRPTGLGVDVGVVASNRVTTEAVVGVRLDYGMFSPQVRLVLGLNYFRGQLQDDELDAFARRLRGLVRDPSGDATIAIGTIRWTNVEATADLHYLFPAGRRVVPYLGLGLGIHVRDGDGAAIEGTFVEDALDTIAAGVNGTIGVDILLGRHLSWTIETRGGWTSELRVAVLRSGFMYRWRAGGGP